MLPYLGIFCSVGLAWCAGLFCRCVALFGALLTCLRLPLVYVFVCLLFVVILLYVVIIVWVTFVC